MEQTFEVRSYTFSGLCDFLELPLVDQRLHHLRGVRGGENGDALGVLVPPSLPLDADPYAGCCDTEVSLRPMTARVFQSAEVVGGPAASSGERVSPFL